MKYKRGQTAVVLLSTLLLIMSFQNCGSQVSFNTPSTSASNAAAGVTVPPTSSNVCDPLGSSGTTPTQANSGLVGTLHYLTTSQLTDPNLSSDFDSFSEVYNGALGYYTGNVFLSAVDVPTQNFTQGFSDNSGNELLQANGSPLQQYFALQLQSVLVLGNLPAGNYQFAILSDDGANVTISGAITNSDGSTSDLVINNDGGHSNKLGCNAAPVSLTANSQYPMTVQYYQGPPVSIAAMILYRPAPAGNTHEQDIGIVEGDNYYFNTAVVPSAPEQPYVALQSRGWSPLPASNYVLPGSTVNPCVQ